jgi:hypothetical protein
MESSTKTERIAASGARYSPDSPRHVCIQAAETSTSAFSISPVRGSTFDGPTAYTLRFVAVHLTVE